MQRMICSRSTAVSVQNGSTGIGTLNASAHVLDAIAAFVTGKLEMS
jgi:hypothetical protein